jgi:hypothetical protein
MLTALQDPFLPNPFAPDTRESEPTKADTGYGFIAIDLASDDAPLPDWIANAKPPAPDTVPLVQYNALLDEYASETSYLKKEIVAMRDEIARLNKVLHQQSALPPFPKNMVFGPGIVQGAQAQPSVKPAPGMIQTMDQREKEAIYSLCNQFSDISTVDFESHDYNCSVQCTVVTRDGARHFSTAERKSGYDIIGICEVRMHNHLIACGYGLGTTPHAPKLGDVIMNRVFPREGDTITAEKINEMVAKMQAMQATPRPPGQPPNHDMQIANRPITCDDILHPPHVIDEYSSALQKYAIQGIGCVFSAEL